MCAALSLTSGVLLSVTVPLTRAGALRPGRSGARFVHLSLPQSPDGKSILRVPFSLLKYIRKEVADT